MKTVTGIMLTRNRNAWATSALVSFMNQTYPDKRLIILDDSEEPSFSASPVFEGVSYMRSKVRSIAEKRNICCSLAKTELIVHVDDDDWSAPERIAYQVKQIEESGKQVAGFCSMLFTDGVRAAKYINDASYALGTSLMYRRDWALAHPFKLMEKAWGEDNNFVNEARNAGELISVDAGQLMVARAHPGNTSHKDLTKQDYRPVPLSAIPEGFFQ